MTRSAVPKYIERETGIVIKSYSGKSTNGPMNFKKAEARKWRSAQNKGRGVGGGYWGKLGKEQLKE